MRAGVPACRFPAAFSVAGHFPGLESPGNRQTGLLPYDEVLGFGGGFQFGLGFRLQFLKHRPQFFLGLFVHPIDE